MRINIVHFLVFFSVSPVINEIHWCVAGRHLCIARGRSTHNLYWTVQLLMARYVQQWRDRQSSNIAIFFIQHLHSTPPLILIVYSMLDRSIQSATEMLPLKLKRGRGVAHSCSFRVCRIYVLQTHLCLFVSEWERRGPTRWNRRDTAVRGCKVQQYIHASCCSRVENPLTHAWDRWSVCASIACQVSK